MPAVAHKSLSFLSHGFFSFGCLICVRTNWSIISCACFTISVFLFGILPFRIGTTPLFLMFILLG